MVCVWSKKITEQLDIKSGVVITTKNTLDNVRTFYQVDCTPTATSTLQNTVYICVCMYVQYSVCVYVCIVDVMMYLKQKGRLSAFEVLTLEVKAHTMLSFARECCRGLQRHISERLLRKDWSSSLNMMGSSSLFEQVCVPALS